VARYVALLRAINVGGTSVMKMADLRARCEALGCEDVSTYIQTGNVLLSSDESAATLTDRLEEELGTRVFVLTPAALRKAATANPLRADGWRSHLLFCDGRPRTEALEEKGADQYRFAARDKVLYYAFPEELAGRRRSLDFERLAGVAGTARSAKVVDELVERL
jgi:uncharacterized protein (DUF1697 family)